MSLPFKFELGSKVKEIVSGSQGIVMGRTEYSTGCNTYGIMREGVDKDKKSHEWQWFDENRLKLLKKGVMSFDNDEPGGPRESYAPSR